MSSPLKEVKGNLIDLAEQGEFDVIVHGCNCFSTMGSGIAKEIRERYPTAANADAIFLSNESQIMKLGNYSHSKVISPTDHPFTIVNAYTQFKYLPRGVDHFDYQSFDVILRKLLATYPMTRFGFPYIGMGLAGGDSVRIISMLQKFASDVAVTWSTVALVEYNS